MADLLLRLREASGPGDGGDPIEGLCQEAADEIERLRTLLAEQANYLDRHPGNGRQVAANLANALKRSR